MTTIALKDGVLAIDSQITTMDMITYRPKMYVCEGLGAIAICGQMDNAENIARWLFRGCSGFKPGQEWSAHYLTAQGQAFRVQGDTTILYSNPIEFDGCGGIIAHTAMHLGKDAYTAVKTAIELDPHTGGEVCWYDASTGKHRNAIVLDRDDLEPIDYKIPNHFTKQED